MHWGLQTLAKLVPACGPSGKGGQARVKSNQPLQRQINFHCQQPQVMPCGLEKFLNKTCGCWGVSYTCIFMSSLQSGFLGDEFGCCSSSDCTLPSIPMGVGLQSWGPPRGTGEIKYPAKSAPRKSHVLGDFDFRIPVHLGMEMQENPCSHCNREHGAVSLEQQHDGSFCNSCWTCYNTQTWVERVTDLVLLSLVILRSFFCYCRKQMRPELTAPPLCCLFVVSIQGLKLNCTCSHRPSVGFGHILWKPSPTVGYWQFFIFWLTQQKLLEVVLASGVVVYTACLAP